MLEKPRSRARLAPAKAKARAVLDRALLARIAREVKADFDRVGDLDAFQEQFKGGFYD